MKGLTFKVNEIIVGSNLAALYYAYKNNLPLVYQNISKPNSLERFSENTDLSSLNIKNEITSFQTPRGEVKKGIKKIFLWNKLFFNLNLKGLVVCPDSPTSSRIGANVFTCFYGTTSLRIDFDKATIFNGENIAGVQTVHNNLIQVFDWMNINSGSKQNKQVDILESNDNFVKKIIFYPSKRSGNTKYKDCLAISYLTEKNLREVEYTDTYAMFKVRQMMKAAGLKGVANGFYDQYPDKRRHYDIRISPTKRQINKDILSCYLDEDTDTISFNLKTIEEMLSDQ